MEATATQQAAPPPRLRERYEQEILPELTKKFGYTTPMQAPHLIKITLNMGLGTDSKDFLSCFSVPRPMLRVILIRCGACIGVV